MPKDISMKFGMGLPSSGYNFCDGRVNFELRRTDGRLIRGKYFGSQPLGSNSFINETGIEIRVDGAPLPVEDIEIFPFGYINETTVKGQPVRLRTFIRGKVIYFELKAERKTELSLHVPDAAWIKEQKRDGKPTRTVFERVKNARDTILFKIFDSVTIERKSASTNVAETHTPHLPDLHMEGETCVGIVADGKATVTEDRAHNLTLTASSSSTSLVAMVFADSLKEWQSLAKQVSPARLEKDWSTQVARYRTIARDLPSFETGYHSHLPHFIRMQPQYIQSMMVDDSGAFRADNLGYWVWGWDSTLPSFGLLNAGRFDDVKGVLLFLNRTCRDDGGIGHAYTTKFEHFHTYTISGAHNLNFISLAFRYWARSGDAATVKRIYPQLKKIFWAISGLTDETGMVLTRGMGTSDFPEEFGRTSFGYVALEMGWWYEACRVMVHMAKLNGDAKTRARADELAERILANFLRLEYNPATGFLNEAVHRPAQKYTDTYDGDVNDTAVVTNLGCMHGLYGEDLIFEQEEGLADFVEKNLLKLDGIHFKPEWEKRGWYGWTHIGENWFPAHDLYVGRILRKCGRAPALQRLLDLYDRTFAWFHSPPEGISHRRPLTTVTKWQAFASASWYSNVVEAIAGIECDLGGITWVVSDLSMPVTLKGIRHRQSVWDIEIKGRGNFASELVIDGKKLEGTLKAPAAMCAKGHHRLVVEREGVLERPVLAEAVNAAVIQCASRKDRLSLVLDGEGHVPMKFLVPHPPEIRVNGRPIPMAYDARRKLARATTVMKGRTRVEVRG